MSVSLSIQVNNEDRPDLIPFYQDVLFRTVDRVPDGILSFFDAQYKEFEGCNMWAVAPLDTGAVLRIPILSDMSEENRSASFIAAFLLLLALGGNMIIVADSPVKEIYGALCIDGELQSAGVSQTEEWIAPYRDDLYKDFIVKTLPVPVPPENMS